MFLGKWIWLMYGFKLKSGPWIYLKCREFFMDVICKSQQASEESKPVHINSKQVPQ